MTGYTSIKEDVLKKISDKMPEIHERFGVETLGIFGSVSRGEDTPDSDVDVLYQFVEGRGRLRDYAGAIEYLETLFGRNIDFVSLKWMSRTFRESIENDMILSTYSEEATV